MLKFSASLQMAAGRPPRRDGGCEQRRALIITHHPADEDHPTSELSIEELHPDGSTSTLVKRRRVDKPEAAATQNEIFRLHPKGQGGDLMARLHWPATPCVLEPADVLVGQPLRLFGLDMRIDGPADEATRAWLDARGLHGGAAVVPPAPPAGVASTDAALADEEPLAFFLGGPRPDRHAVQPLAEHDDASLLTLQRQRAAAWPSLRGAPAARPRESNRSVTRLHLASRLDQRCCGGDCCCGGGCGGGGGGG